MASRPRVLTLNSDIQRRILEILDRGVTARAAAEQIGITAAYAREIARKAGYRLKERHLEQQAARREQARGLLIKGTHADDVAAAVGLHRSRVYALRAKMDAEQANVPSWVPSEYRWDYATICQQEDEFAAAAWVRRQKQKQAA